MKQERIDKIIATCSSYSRNELKKAAKDGRVVCNGETVYDLSKKADPDIAEIYVDGNPIKVKKYTYIMLNKPLGVISASDGRGEKTVVDILPDSLKREGLFPAGRLDKYTTGFVLITNDGDFAHNILSPRHHVKKTYIVTTDALLDDKALSEFEKGISLSDGTLFKPASIRLLDRNAREYEVIIVEGKYHQIKRMFSHFGAKVIKLHRTAMGNLTLDPELASGEARELSADELLKISQKDD